MRGRCIGGVLLGSLFIWGYCIAFTLDGKEKEHENTA